MMKVYATNEKIDPGVNPFVGQQLLVDDAAPLTDVKPVLPPEPAIEQVKPANVEMIQEQEPSKPVVV
jgi:hypothetical protein